LPDDLFTQLGKEAKTGRVTKSWLVRESLKKGLHEQPPAGAVSCYGLARDLAGTVKGLPKDLADNPKYMQGFGPSGGGFFYPDPEHKWDGNSLP
jgi:hypothetical protein